MKSFFHPAGINEFADLFTCFNALGAETVPLPAALNRITAKDITAPADLPLFTRSTMDGYAVRAEDTISCNEFRPALLAITNEILMGRAGRDIILKPGETARIWTGGELPGNADAVVMIEDSRMLDETTILVHRAVVTGENVIRVGEDYRQGEIVLTKGVRLCPKHMGVLAGLGITGISVFRRPVVGIISSGDELVVPGSKPAPGQTRDINATTLSALVSEAGAVPLLLGIVGDDFELLRGTCRAAVNRPVDVLLVSGGSSAGNRDYTQAVFRELDQSDLQARGTAIRPGKPLVIARHNNCALFGLPGHAASAMTVFHLFVRPLLQRFFEAEHDGLQRVFACIGERISSTIGHEEYVRVRLERRNNGELPLAYPVYGKAGFLKPLVEADGVLMLGRDCGELDTGEQAEVILFS